MKSEVGRMLDQGGWQAYEGWLLSRICELMDAAREDTFEGLPGWALKEGLAQLETLEGAELLGYGTPFFWKNIHSLYRIQQTPNQLQTIRDVLMTGFDSYFHLMQDGACVALPDAERLDLILPRLGLAIRDLSHVRLRRRSSQILEVQSAAGTLTIDLTGPFHKWQARTCKIFTEGSETVIAIADPAVAASDGTDIFDGDIQPFSERVTGAMRLIGSVDSELYGAIRKLIHWFVPLKMPSPPVRFPESTLHPSYSAANMIGVVHMSERYPPTLLAESVVHEFHHNELSVLESTQKLTDEDGKAVFYSPVRTDPRPLMGLFHALHVFSAIVRFYGMAESHAGADLDRPLARRRRSEFYHKVRIGLLQAPLQSLPPLGRRFLHAIEDDLLRQEPGIQPLPEASWDAIRCHARTWCRANPECVPYLRWPEGVQELLG